MIYADNAATTKISESAFKKMLPYLKDQYGNASSQYAIGMHAKDAIEHARQQAANAIGANPFEIIFTSGGSEANNWIFRSVSEMYPNQAIHLITSSIEHHSVLNTCHALEASGIEITYLPVNQKGVIAMNDLQTAIKPNTKLVSLMLANNEIGTIQPIAEIGKFLHGRDILFHTDAVQAVGHIPINVNELQVDFLSASAHKFNGAKGTGFLYKNSAQKILPMIYGGSQELGFRAGTENVAGIVALGYALEENIAAMQATASLLKILVDQTIKGILEKLPFVSMNGDYEKRLPGTVNLRFEGISGESLMHLLDLKGICVSTSSACNAGNDAPSHVLLALGQSEEQAKSAIRISYGRYNTLEEVDIIIENICNACNKILHTIKK